MIKKQDKPLFLKLSLGLKNYLRLFLKKPKMALSEIYTHAGFQLQAFVLQIRDGLKLKSLASWPKNKQGIKKRAWPHVAQALLSAIFFTAPHTMTGLYAYGETQSVMSQKRPTSPDTEYEQCKTQNMPSIITNSMYWNGKGSIYRSLRALSPPSIVVTAAGNNAPQPVSPLKDLASKQFGAIIVGSLRSSGQRSSFSQSSSEVTIMAPGDYNLTSSDDQNRYRKFGGTSGATPLVSASLAGFEWLSHYHPTPEEAKLLLKKTAIPTSGGPMLNSYKLGMVGKALAKACKEEQNKLSCIKEKIKDEDTYKPENLRSVAQLGDFSHEQMFPECSSSQDQCSPSQNQGEKEKKCYDQEGAFLLLRKEALLDPSNKQLWKKLACVYKKSGFSQNSKGALSAYQALKTKETGRPLSSCASDEDCQLVSYCDDKHKEYMRKKYQEAQTALNDWERRNKADLTPIRRMPDFFALSRSMAEVYYLQFCGDTDKKICERTAEFESKQYESQCQKTGGGSQGRCVLREAGAAPAPTQNSACETDADCALVPQGCCGCERGGSSIAILLANKASYMARRNNRCSSQSSSQCSSLNSCSGVAKCENSGCIVAPLPSGASPRRRGSRGQR